MPNQKTAAYLAMCGSVGCLPDSYMGPIEIPTRRALVQFVDSTLEDCGFSKRARRQISIARVWAWIQRHGCDSNASFTVEDTARGSLYRIEFRALTREEFETAERESE